MTMTSKLRQALAGRVSVIAVVSVACSLAVVPADSAEPQASVYPEHQDLLYVLDADGAKQPVTSVKGWEQRRAHVRANIQSVMGELPRPAKPVPLDVQVLEEKTIEGMLRRKISYHTDSSERRVNAWLFLPQGKLPGPASGEASKRPAMLCLHQTTGIGKDEPAGLGGNPDLAYALHLARRGYVTLAPDYPSFGEYEYSFPPENGYISGSMKAITDNMRAVDLLASLPEVDADRIGCIGHSLGGHNTMFTAFFDERIRVMVSNCGFTRFHKYYGGRLKGWTSTRYMPLINSRYNNDADQVPFDFTEIVASFAPRPFLASSPTMDSNFEVSGVKDTIAAAQKVYALYDAEDNLQANYPECGHSFPPDVRTVAYAFLDRHLKHTPPAGADPAGRAPRQQEEGQQQEQEQKQGSAETGQRPSRPDLLHPAGENGTRRVISNAAEWEAERRRIVAAFERMTGPLPQLDSRRPLDLKVLSEEQLPGVLRRKVSYVSHGGHRVPAWLLLPQSDAAEDENGAVKEMRRPAVLCLHQTFRGGKDEPAGVAGSPDLYYALELTRRGYITLAPDYPSLGEHQWDFAADNYDSGTMKAIVDNIRAVDLLASLAEVDAGRIGCIGHSLGGHNAIFTAVFEPRLKAIVSSCGFSSYYTDDVPSWNGPRYMPRIRTLFENRAERLPVDFPQLIAALAPRAFLASACLHDGDFDARGVQDCLAAAQPVYELFDRGQAVAGIYPDAAHSFPAAARRQAYAFLDEHLQRKAITSAGAANP